MLDFDRSYSSLLRRHPSELLEEIIKLSTTPLKLNDLKHNFDSHEFQDTNSFHCIIWLKFTLQTKLHTIFCCLGWMIDAISYLLLPRKQRCGQ